MRRFCFSSSDGVKPGAKGDLGCQDRSFSFNYRKSHVVGIFDGHGTRGGEAAQTASDVTRRKFQESAAQLENFSQLQWKEFFSSLSKELEESLRQTFLEMKYSDGKPMYHLYDGDVCDESGNIVRGGTTATICANVGSLWISANVGDSDAYLQRVGEEPVKITADHKPNNPAEFQRVTALHAAGQIEHKPLFVYDIPSILNKERCPEIFDKDGRIISKFVDSPWSNGLKPSNVRYEPGMYMTSGHSVRSQDKFTIAMTRSIGDFAGKKSGMSCEFDVSFWEIHEGDLLAVYSDGIGDCQTLKNVREMFESIRSSPNLRTNLLDILRINQTFASKTFGKSCFDDASIAAIFCQVDESTESAAASPEPTEAAVPEATQAEAARSEVAEEVAQAQAARSEVAEEVAQTEAARSEVAQAEAARSEIAEEVAQAEATSPKAPKRDFDGQPKSCF